MTDSNRRVPWSDLLGRRVLDVVAREFWHEGMLVSPCSPIFLKDDLESFWRLSWDDEVWGWDLDPWCQKAPQAGYVSAGDNMEWRDVDVAGKSALVGAKVEGFTCGADEVRVTGMVRFSNGCRLLVTHDRASERLSYTIEV